MRILVVSDSHGRLYALRQAIRQEGNFALLLHLGDGAGDVQRMLPLPGGQPVLQVRGNCDLGFPELAEQLVTQEGGKTLLCTHGHRLSVKYSEQPMTEAARKAHADIALYGHTHVPVQHYADGLYVCNPGALCLGHYAVLEITPQGVMWLPKTVDPAR